VSVLIPSYNHERYVAEAIESVLNQTVSDLELIIIDDCSSDNSRKIIEQYSSTDSRVRAFFHEKNMGIARGINEFFDLALGEYASFLGSDDVWFPSKLEQQLAIITENPDSIMWSEGIIIDKNGSPTGKTTTQLLSAPKRKSGNLFQDLLKEDFILGQSALFRTADAKAVKLSEAFAYVNDHLFFVELAKNHSFLFTDQPLVKYRLHGENITSKNEQKWMVERLELRRLFIERYSGEVSIEAECDIYYKMGHAFSKLGEREIAKQCYIKAMRIDPFHASTILFVILALTDGDGFFGKLLTDFYTKMISVFHLSALY
jgi:glycosyltransferase involved in cell wall biosynthesis